MAQCEDFVEKKILLHDILKKIVVEVIISTKFHAELAWEGIE